MFYKMLFRGGRSFILLLILLQLLACQQSEVSVKYPDAKRAVQVAVSGYYSTFSDGKEETGTVVKAFMRYDWQRENGVEKWQRSFEMDQSQGYHKQSMPTVLSMRAPVSLRADEAQGKLSVDGFSYYYDSLIPQMQIPDAYKAQLLDTAYEQDFREELQKEWFWKHLLKGQVKTESSASFAPLPAFSQKTKIDSLVVLRTKESEGRTCLEYKVYYHEDSDYMEYIWEQWSRSTAEGKKYKHYWPQSGRSDVERTILISLEDGFPCRESELRREQYLLQDKESGDEYQMNAMSHLEYIYTDVEEP